MLALLVRGLFLELYVDTATILPKLDPSPERIGPKNVACDEPRFLKGFALELASHMDPAVGSNRAVPVGVHARSSLIRHKSVALRAHARDAAKCPCRYVCVLERVAAPAYSARVIAFAWGKANGTDQPLQGSICVTRAR